MSSRSVPQQLAAMGVLLAAAAQGQLSNPYTFTQDQLRDLGGSFSGTVSSVAPSGSGVLLVGESSNDGGFTRLNAQLNFAEPGLDLTGFDGISLNITPVGGDRDSVKMFVQTGSSFFFQESEVFSLVGGTTSEVVFDFGVLGTLQTDRIRSFGFQFFGPDVEASTQQIRIEPTGDVGPAACSLADFAEPLGALDLFDILGFFETFARGCPTVLAPFGTAEILTFETSFAGTVDSNAPEADGARIIGTTQDEGGFSRLAIKSTALGLVDWSGSTEVALEVQVISGSLNNTKMFLQSDTTPADPEDDSFTFVESPLTDLGGGTARVAIPLGSVSSLDSVEFIGFQFFANGGITEQIELIITPATIASCGDADLAVPRGALDLFDILGFFDIFAAGCP